MATHEELARRLGDSGLELLARMVELHLNRRPGSRAEFIWIKSDSMASDATALSFAGSTQALSIDLDHDPVDFQEMIDTRIVPRAGTAAMRTDSRTPAGSSTESSPRRVGPPPLRSSTRLSARSSTIRPASLARILR